MTVLSAAALAYADVGLSVFRLSAREKKPLADTRGFKDAVTDAAIVRRWWADRPNCNIGIATGAVSGCWVLDLDGPEADEDLGLLEAKHGALPATAEQRTGKGRQLFFAWTPIEDGRWPPVRNLSKGSRERIGRAIDVRGDGGYVVAPPSIHPNGRTYAWAAGRAPNEVGFAEAPAWLMQLVIPPPEPVRPPAPVGPRPVIEGRASRYAEKALDNACREIATAGPGTKNDTLWLKAVGMGQLRGGGEFVDDAYPLDALRRAGEQMCAWSGREESTLLRGFKLGVSDPRTAPERRERASASPRPVQAPRVTAAEAARVGSEAQRLWSQATSAWWTGAEDWLIARELDPYALPDALAKSLRVHRDAPWGDGRTGPALLAPLVSDWEPAPHTVDGVAVLPLGPDCQRFTHFVGETAQRVAVLDAPDDPEGWLIALDLQDAWALASAARAEEWRLVVLIAPSLSAFAGAPLGDRFGRIDPDTPLADPASPPFVVPGVGDRSVQLAVRGDLRGPPLKMRKAMGGTTNVRLQGDAAARFYGGLAEQAWRSSGANRVRVLRPTGGAAGFNNGRVA